jgi:hypothetical protein
MKMMNKIPKKVILGMLTKIVNVNDDIMVETLAVIDNWLSKNILILNIKEPYYYLNFFPGSKINRKELDKNLLQYLIDNRYHREYCNVLDFDQLDVERYVKTIKYATDKIEYYSAISTNDVIINEEEFNQIRHQLIRSNDIIKNNLEGKIVEELNKFNSIKIISDITCYEGY